MSSELNNLEFEEPQYNKTLWAMSLADLLSIVLSIFVLLFAVSQINKAKSDRAMNGVHGKFSQKNLTLSKDVISIPELKTNQDSASGAQQPLRLYYAGLKKVAKDLLAVDEANIIEKGNMMIMRLPVYLMFKPGSADLEDKKLFMQKLADQLVMTVANHNIDVQFMTGYNPLNDKDAQMSGLAIARAGAFSRKMVELGVNEDAVYAGMSDSDPDTIIITFFPRDETRSSLVF
jgi:chemotaxis protein MotB